MKNIKSFIFTSLKKLKPIFTIFLEFMFKKFAPISISFAIAIFIAQAVYDEVKKYLLKLFKISILYDSFCVIIIVIIILMSTIIITLLIEAFFNFILKFIKTQYNDIVEMKNKYFYKKTQEIKEDRSFYVVQEKLLTYENSINIISQSIYGKFKITEAIENGKIKKKKDIIISKKQRFDNNLLCSASNMIQDLISNPPTREEVFNLDDDMERGLKERLIYDKILEEMIGGQIINIDNFKIEKNILLCFLRNKEIVIREKII